jgi:hypothetical protein
MDKAQGVEDKVSTILELDFGRKDDFEITTQDDAVEIKLPDVCKYDQLWMIAKYKVVNDLREYAGVAKIRFIEEYVKKEEEKKEEGEEGKKEGEIGEEKEGEEVEEIAEDKPKEETEVSKEPSEEKTEEEKPEETQVGESNQQKK